MTARPAEIKRAHREQTVKAMAKVAFGYLQQQIGQGYSPQQARRTVMRAFIHAPRSVVKEMWSELIRLTQ